MKIGLKEIAIFIFLLIIVVGICFLVYSPMFYADKLDNFCIEKGFDYNDYFSITTKGYISCCSYVYEDHIRIENNCTGVRYE